jgi:hypothetical protein
MIWDPSCIPLDEMQKGATSANRSALDVALAEHAQCQCAFPGEI